MEKRFLCIDLETTGIDTAACEILQVAAMTNEGAYCEYFCPTKATSWPEAQAVNKISPEMVSEMPSFEERMWEIQEMIDNADVIIGYNHKCYDLPILKRYGIIVPQTKDVCDVMLEFAKYRGVYKDNGRLKWWKLKDAAEHFGYTSDGFHDALEDVRATLYLYYKLQS